MEYREETKKLIRKLAVALYSELQDGGDCVEIVATYMEDEILYSSDVLTTYEAVKGILGIQKNS